MGKRSDFIKRKNDFYPTPFKALEPLKFFLPDDFLYVEPCAGDGRLIKHISTIRPNAKCILAIDIDQSNELVIKRDAFSITKEEVGNNQIITNPPWTRTKASGYLMHSLIEHFLNITSNDIWLLFDADWAHTEQSIKLMSYCSDIVPIGRVKWIEDSPYTSKDNACWYKFNSKANKTIFHKRFKK